MSDQEDWVEADEVGPKLLLFGPSAFPDDFADRLKTALSTGAVAAFVVDPAALAEAPPSLELPDLQAACSRHDVALFVLDDIALARRASADGLHLSDPGRIAEARRILGPGRVIGASCDLSRHAAMVAGEDGTDYVLFGALDGRATSGIDELAATVTWWSELFVLPVAAATRPVAKEAATLARAGAAFLASDGAGDLAATAIMLAEALDAVDPDGRGEPRE